MAQWCPAQALEGTNHSRLYVDRFCFQFHKRRRALGSGHKVRCSHGSARLQSEEGAAAALFLLLLFRGSIHPPPGRLCSCVRHFVPPPRYREGSRLPSSGSPKGPCWAPEPGANLLLLTVFYPTYPAWLLPHRHQRETSNDLRSGFPSAKSRGFLSRDPSGDAGFGRRRRRSSPPLGTAGGHGQRRSAGDEPKEGGSAASPPRPPPTAFGSFPGLLWAEGRL